MSTRATLIFPAALAPAPTVQTNAASGFQDAAPFTANAFAAVYVHSNGEPSKLGAILNEHYATEDGARALAALGGIYSLGTTTEPQPAETPDPATSPQAFRRHYLTLTAALDSHRPAYVSAETLAADFPRRYHNAEHVYTWTPGGWSHQEADDYDGPTPREIAAARLGPQDSQTEAKDAAPQAPSLPCPASDGDTYAEATGYSPGYTGGEDAHEAEQETSSTAPQADGFAHLDARADGLGYLIARHPDGGAYLRSASLGEPTQHAPGPGMDPASAERHIERLELRRAAPQAADDARDPYPQSAAQLRRDFAHTEATNPHLPATGTVLRTETDGHTGIYERTALGLRPVRTLDPATDDYAARLEHWSDADDEREPTAPQAFHGAHGTAGAVPVLASYAFERTPGRYAVVYERNAEDPTRRGFAVATVEHAEGQWAEVRSGFLTDDAERLAWADATRRSARYAAPQDESGPAVLVTTYNIRGHGNGYWRAVTDKSWYLTRNADGKRQDGATPTGRLRTFESREAAQARADELNTTAHRYVEHDEVTALQTPRERKAARRAAHLARFTEAGRLDAAEGITGHPCASERYKAIKNGHTYFRPPTAQDEMEEQLAYSGGHTAPEASPVEPLRSRLGSALDTPGSAARGALEQKAAAFIRRHRTAPQAPHTITHEQTEAGAQALLWPRAAGSARTVAASGQLAFL